MKKVIAATVMAVALMGAVASPAAAGEWTCDNPAGNQVQGQCNGEALVHVNPGGNVPPGQNK